MPWYGGLALGIVFAGTFILGFLVCLRIRFWKARVEESQKVADVELERELERERSLMEGLDAASVDEREADGQSVPVGPPPPMPGDIQRRRVLSRLRNPLGMGG